MKYMSGSSTITFEKYIEEFVNKFSKENKYIIFGVGQKALKVREKISNILFHVDNDKKKWGTKINGLEVKSPEVLKEYPNVKIIVAVHSYIEVNEQLKSFGIPEENYCNYREILMLQDYLSKGIIFVPEISFIINNRCTLNCKGCIEYIPYIKKQIDFSYEKIKDSFDDFFEYVDYCEDITLVGGETLLYKELVQLLKYLYETYIIKGRAKRIKITTNATIVPNINVVQALKKYEVVVVMSDYKTTIGNRCKICDLITLFEQNEIKYLVENHFSRVEEGKWFDMGNPFSCHNMSKQQLIEHFDKCTVACWAVWNSKLFNCNAVRSSMANLGMIEDRDNDYCDLKRSSKVQFLKYYLGYNNKGYYNFCNYCNGYGEYLNKTSILPGEQ